jgi:uncharacterized protein YecE (DUF72 family)
VDVDTLFVYFNNDPEGAAFANAEAFASMLDDRGVRVSAVAGDQDVSDPPRLGTTS